MTNPAGRTAYGPMSVIAIEQSYPKEQRLVHDELAIQFLPPSVKWLVKLTQWPPARALMFNLSEKSAAGVWGGVLCRKRYIDDRLLEALNDGIDAVVNLGAGLDTRCYRFPALSALPVFEVDLPENIEYKKGRLQQIYGGVPAHVTLVPIDFDRQDLASVLASQGFRADYKCFFIWEAVTQYLTGEGIQKSFNFLAQAGAGSRLVFTYVYKDFIDGITKYGLDNLYQTYRERRRWWHFGFDPEHVATFLKGYGWKEIEQVGTQEYTDRYLISYGRPMPILEIERAVYAQKI